MIIDKYSWHYRWCAKHWDSDPKALCWYFWKIVITIIGMFVYGVFMFLLGTLVTVLLTIPFWQWFVNGIDMVFSVLAFLIWFGIGVTANRIYRTYLYDTGQIKRKEKPYREPSLISQYLDAQHRKVCPLLEYKYVNTE